MWFGMRIQAKRIKLPKETFYRLQKYHAKNNRLSQIDNLLTEAKKDNLNAAYCLYFMSKKQPDLGKDRCFIAGAFALKAAGKDTLSDLALVCVTLASFDLC